MAVGAKFLIITWLQRGRRNVLQVRPRDDRTRSMSEYSLLGLRTGRTR
jgi:hypothetical protein